MPVQINGRLRSRIVAAINAGKEELEAAALSDARVRKHLAGVSVKKVIVVPGKLINIVAN
jgi:leucyl-tRNA synthetase